MSEISKMKLFCFKENIEAIYFWKYFILTLSVLYLNRVYESNIPRDEWSVLKTTLVWGEIYDILK